MTEKWFATIIHVTSGVTIPENFIHSHITFLVLPQNYRFVTKPYTRMYKNVKFTFRFIDIMERNSIYPDHVELSNSKLLWEMNRPLQSCTVANMFGVTSFFSLFFACLKIEWKEEKMLQKINFILTGSSHCQ